MKFRRSAKVNVPVAQAASRQITARENVSFLLFRRAVQAWRPDGPLAYLDAMVAYSDVTPPGYTDSEWEDVREQCATLAGFLRAASEMLAVTL